MPYNPKRLKPVLVRHLITALLLIGLCACNSKESQSANSEAIGYPDINIVGAMKNVMWKGELDASIDLDTIKHKKNLFGLGPESYLKGEILVIDGTSYSSRVISDSTMLVKQDFEVSAPFFVYTNVSEWEAFEIPSKVKSIEELEEFIDEKSIAIKRPFAFKLSGSISNAIIHIQNLPEGTEVSSPEEAHQGQTNYKLKDQPSDIIGFFSIEHKGIFTHHDSYLHMHLITEDRSKMGHLDELEIGTMTLFLPKK